jgi:hypothetical protein
MERLFFLCLLKVPCQIQYVAIYCTTQTRTRQSVLSFIFTALSVARTILGSMVGLIINNEFEGMWKEVISG